MSGRDKLNLVYFLAAVGVGIFVTSMTQSFMLDVLTFAGTCGMYVYYGFLR